jgi:hypothetical protein
MWWRSDPDQNLYIYYDDGNSKQWVNAVPTVSQPVGPAGGSLSGSYPNPGLKATAATIKSTTTQALANGVGTGLIMPTVLLDSSGGTIPATATNAVKSPGLGWVTISGFVQLSAGLTGGACGLEIDQSTDGGASFPTVVAQSEMVQGAYATQLSVAVLKDASAGMQFRLQFTNFSGAALTANLATLTLLYNGVQ